MAQIKRFGYGLQALMLLAAENKPMTSTEIAGAINCEPTALRKVMSDLAETGLLEVRQGRAGGYKLSLRPEQIPLLAVYQAVRDDEAEWDGILQTISQRAAALNTHLAFKRIITDIKAHVEQVLGHYTVADLME